MIRFILVAFAAFALMGCADLTGPEIETHTAQGVFFADLADPGCIPLPDSECLEVLESVMYAEHDQSHIPTMTEADGGL